MKNRVQETRQARGMRQVDLASASGLSLETVRAIETGATVPLVTTARRIAEALGVGLDALFVEDDAA